MSRRARFAALLLSAAIVLLTTGLWKRADAEQPRNSSEIAVAFWNIQWFPGRRPDASDAEEAAQIASVHADISRLRADLIGFAEVRDWQNAELAVKPLPGFKIDVISNFPPREGQVEAQQVGIASRLPAMSAWAEQWKAGETVTPSRGFAFAAYEVAPRELLLVYSVHLKSNGGPNMEENIAMREESARQLVAHMQAMEKAYGKLGQITWVVGGDFNTSLDDERFRNERSLRLLLDLGFHWSGKNIPVQKRATVRGSRYYPPAAFDHIAVKGAAPKWAEVVYTSRRSSDHRAIRTVLDLSAPH